MRHPLYEGSFLIIGLVYGEKGRGAIESLEEYATMRKNYGRLSSRKDELFSLSKTLTLDEIESYEEKNSPFPEQDRKIMKANKLFYGKFSMNLDEFANNGFALSNDKAAFAAMAQFYLSDIKEFTNALFDTDYALNMKLFGYPPFLKSFLGFITEDTAMLEEGIHELRAESKKAFEEDKLNAMNMSREQIILNQKKAVETTLIGMQHEIRSYEDKINNFNIQIAQHKAHLDTLKSDFREFETLEVFNQPISEVQDRLSKSQIKLAQIGSVNMRALEVYDKVKESCDLIQQKVTTIESEKEKIMKIIGEIDKKKRKSFLTTLDAVNESFTRNFSQLSKKGEVFLDLENKQEPFLGGLNIIVKVGKGKYFDITSLSGGEKTLIALSLIFAIQEHLLLIRCRFPLRPDRRLWSPPKSTLDNRWSEIWWSAHWIWHHCPTKSRLFVHQER